MGVNLFPPLGSIFFSVGAGGGGAAGDVVAVEVVVGVVEVSGAFSPPPHAEVIAMMAAIPANAGRRRAKGRDCIVEVLFYRARPATLGELLVAVGLLPIIAQLTAGYQKTSIIDTSAN